MVRSLSKLCDLTLCKKCSVSSQELTSFLMWFIWLFKHRLNPVSLLPMYGSLHVLHYIFILPRKKTNKLPVHPYRPVSGSPTHQKI